MKIYSVFKSLNGEVNAQKVLSMTTFVRFAGCTAQCSYCDTTYAKDFNAGTEQSLDDVMHQISAFECNNVTITGGEPFEQRHSLAGLVCELRDNGYLFSIETNGLHAFSKRNSPRCFANFAVDIKLDAWNLTRYRDMYLTPNDYFKIVIGSLDDMKLAVSLKENLQQNGAKAVFAFSPEYQKISPNLLMMWMKDFNQNDAIMNVQLHKVLDLKEEN